jgi:hypothetical protein
MELPSTGSVQISCQASVAHISLNALNGCRAFGYGPNASACEMKSAVRKLLNQGSFLATYPISATAVIKM